MSSIRTIKQQLEPWNKFGQDRYYVNDWVDRIYPELKDYVDSHPKCHPIESIARWAKVWYDANGSIHVEGLYDTWLTNFIAKTMEETQFLDDEYDPYYGCPEIPWSELLSHVPFTLDGPTAVFVLKDREYKVNADFLAHERWTNKAHVTPDGFIHFESESSDLTELVLEIVNDFLKSSPFGMFGDTPMMFAVEPVDVTTSVQKERDGRRWVDHPVSLPPLFPDDPELERHENEQAHRSMSEKAWTKREVLWTCRFVKVPEEALKVLEGMSEKGIRARFLVQAGEGPDGMLYQLNVPAIRKLAEKVRVPEPK